MYRSLREIVGYRVEATDGQLGSIRDFFFEDRFWTLCYPVIDTHNWLPGRQVLVHTDELGIPNWNKQSIPVDLTQEEIKSCPEVNEDKPVSLQKRQKVTDAVAMNAFWAPYGMTAIPIMPPETLKSVEDRLNKTEEGNPHLRSFNEICRYRVEGVDGEAGRVEDFIITDENWKIAYFVVNVPNGICGKKVLISTEWLERISWEERKVFASLESKSIQKAPEFDPNAPINPEYEIRLYDFYGRPHGACRAG